MDARVIITNRTDCVNRPWWPLNVEIPVVRPDQIADPVVRLHDSTERHATRTLVVKEVRRENQISGEVRQFFWQMSANVIRHVSACPGLVCRQGPASHDRITQVCHQQPRLVAHGLSLRPGTHCCIGVPDWAEIATYTYIHTYLHTYIHNFV